MLKEVGASGQISLGKKYAGQLFDAVFYPDGRVELVPMKLVPNVKAAALESTAGSSGSSAHRVEEAQTPYRIGDGWLTPERLAARKAAQERSPQETARLVAQWEAENKVAIDAMNERYRRVGSMGMRLYERRKAKAGGAV